MTKDITRDCTRAVAFFSERLGFLMAQSALKEMLDDTNSEIRVIDVRHRDVFDESRIPGAIYVDADNLDDYWHCFDTTKIHVLYCYSELCHRAARVCLAAAIKGFPVMELHGGFEGWVEYPFPVES